MNAEPHALRHYFSFAKIFAVALAAAFALGTVSARAQDVGAAYFSLLSPKFPCDAALASFEGVKRPALSVLWNTFGRDTHCLSRWFAQVGDKPHVLQIHPFNQPCRRNRRCEVNELFHTLTIAEFNARVEARDASLLQAIRGTVREIKEAIAPFQTAQGEYLLSTGLEDNYSNEAYRAILEVVRSEWPWKVVRNPEGDLSTRVTWDGADYIEAHSAQPKFREGDACIANLDGEDMVWPHRKATTTPRASWAEVQQYVAKYRTKCRVTFLWSSLWQGLKGTKFVPPSKRTFEVSKEDARALAALMASE